MRTIHGTTWSVEDARAYIEDRVHKVPWSGCWLWDGALSRNGYSRCDVPMPARSDSAGRCRKAHRVAYEAFVGPIPRGVDVCHRCDVRACCNPDHLWLGSRTDNMADAASKNRTSRGEGRYNAKLTAETAAAIPRLRAEGWSQPRIAAHFGVSRGTVDQVCRGRSWWRVTGIPRAR
jgi:hypothetical protein